ncbi:hypothetical protein ACWDAZ_05420 [Streptomyces sp. NPDC001215]
MKQALQPIIDRFSVGSIKDINDCKGGWLLGTTQGRFCLLDGGTDLADARATEAERRAQVGPSMRRVLLPDYQGQPTGDASYAHVQGHYYALYRLDEPS